ncbi:nuclear transport factor 2 family protein [Curtobacterium flaccumfaciens]|uniref:nuclear transport factor 2 family protein n=1 Tax=Curtobacterium flaccumfaciens TaxID=2035 RepID=UPI001BE1118B|nr:nuclear transport factor 2 family protein [Curtobacterium flaccumfaciens]MBT1585588.1 nuclear transport factor 2 family protein [Curtobacterium flaccumfaciens pv. flaccumfaciens]MCS5495174.1 nuclear transport factor 2 family protein [Curtobacterium flaccumfaciens pv. flaccumfaciens]MCX2798178.1 nuclear transport factor 2 family protein [Curtobacterium flaccumfaciens pv. flaccumfaciens]
MADDPVFEKFEAIEAELLVRSFLAAFNARDIRQVEAFLHPDASYQATACDRVQGRASVLMVITGLFESLEVFQLTPVSVAVTGDTVLVEQRLQVRFAGESPHELFGLARFTVADGVVLGWRQLHG